MRTDWQESRLEAECSPQYKLSADRVPRCCLLGLGAAASARTDKACQLALPEESSDSATGLGEHYLTCVDIGFDNE